MFDVGEVRLTCKLGFKTIPEQGMTVSRPRGPSCLCYSACSPVLKLNVKHLFE